MFPDGLAYSENGFGTPVTHSIYTLLAADLVDESRLVAPQGFTGVANKGDVTVFHSVPHVIPRTRNKDSYSDSTRTSPHSCSDSNAV
jgi:hypothetical protein